MDVIQDKNVVIVGGMGAIGSALYGMYWLEDPDAEVTIIDKDMNVALLPRIPLEYKFIWNKNGAAGRVRDTLAKADLIYLTVGEGSKELIDEVKKFAHPRTRVIYAHTPPYLVLGQEDGNLQTITEHDDTIETKIERHFIETINNWIIARVGITYGYSPGMDFGSQGNRYILPALVGEKHMYAPKQMHPFTCVTDAARALRFLGEHRDTSYQIFHVAQTNLTLEEFASQVNKLLGNAVAGFEGTKEPVMGYILDNYKIHDYGFKFKWSLRSAMGQIQAMFGRHFN